MTPRHIYSSSSFQLMSLFMSLMFQVDIAAGITPCLSLHHDAGQVHHDAGQEHIPNVLACPFNVRKTYPTLLGFNCVKYNEGLVCRLVEEKIADATSCLLVGGPFRLVFTSYSADTIQENSIPMTSTLADHHNSSCCYHATPLTLKIIKEGIAWLKCVDVNTLSDFTSTEDALREYLATLTDVIPLQRPLDNPGDVVEKVRSFITGRISVEEIPSKVSDFLKNPEEGVFWKMSNLIRKFIYSYVAKKTKVVMSIVDGAHRLSAFECAMTGILPFAVESNYHKRLTHANVLLGSLILIPDHDKLHSGTYVDEMKTLSQQSQESFACQQPHGLKNFVTQLMKEIKMKTTSFFNLTTSDEHIADQINFFAKIITGVICDDKIVEKFVHMIPKSVDLQKSLIKNEEEWSHLFRQKTQGKDKYGKYSFLWNDGRLSIQHMISMNPDLDNRNRYSRMGFDAVVFLMVQLLLWTRLSKESCRELHDCFITNYRCDMKLQISASDKDGEKGKQWLSALVEVIGTSVYYSRWVFHEKLKYSQMMSIGSEELLGRLLKSSITDATQFFSQYGIDPSPPDWFNNVIITMKDKKIITDVLDMIGSKKNVDISGAQSKIETKYKPLVEGLSFISFIKLAYALHLQSQLFVQTGGKPTLRQDLDLSKLKITSVNDIKIIKKDVGESWTTSITDFTDEIAPTLFVGDRCADNTALIINKILDTTNFLGRKKKVAANVAEVVEATVVENNRVEDVEQVTLDLPDLAECAALKKVLICFQSNRNLKEYLKDRISRDISDDLRQSAQRLQDLIKKANPSHLEDCYITEQDQDTDGGDIF